MKNIIRHVTSLALISLFTMLSTQASSSETDPAKLLAALNSKTARNKIESTTENKKRGITTKIDEVYSFVFALDRKEKLIIRFTEEIQTFKNGQYIDKLITFGKVSFNPVDIDPERIKIDNGRVIIICRDLKKCMNRGYQVRETNTKGETTNKATGNYATNSFILRGFNQPLAEKIKKDLQALFTLPALPDPAPKPER